MVLSLNLSAGGGQAAIVAVTVPGTSNPWLTGMPAGSDDNGNDAVPAESPTQVNGLKVLSGESLTFVATGTVDNSGGTATDPPDGNAANTSHSSANGISDVTAPVDALMDVFLGPGQPFGMPPAPLVFSDSNALDYTTLAPRTQAGLFYR